MMVMLNQAIQVSRVLGPVVKSLRVKVDRSVGQSVGHDVLTEVVLIVIVIAVTCYM